MLNNLSDWAGQNSGLSPYPQSAGSQMIGGIGALLAILQKQQQDKAMRQAAGQMLGGKQVPAGVDAGKLYSDIAVEQAKPNEMQQLLDFISKSNQGGNILPNPSSAQSPSSDMLMRGMLSKKFGVPYEQMMTLEETQKLSQQKAQEQATIATEKEKQTNIGKVSRLSNIADVVENKFAETSPKSGALAPISGMIDVVLSGLQSTPNQINDRAYISFVKGFRAQLARAMGDVGNLSEPEQKAAMNLVPTLLDSKETAAKKLQNLRDFIATIQTRGTGGQSQLQNKVGKYTIIQ